MAPRSSYTTRVIRVGGHFLYALGVLSTIVGLFYEGLDPNSSLGRLVAPRFLPAVSGYRQLVAGATPLRRADQGFEEILELADTPATMKAQIADLRVQGVGLTPAGVEMFIQAFDSDNRTVYSKSIYYAEVKLRERFFDPDFHSAKRWLAGIGIALSAAVYLLGALEGKRAQAETLRQLQADVSSIRAEVSDLRKRQNCPLPPSVDPSDAPPG
jgi:hypothetical protein